jgi:hypothetical protein
MTIQSLSRCRLACLADMGLQDFRIPDQNLRPDFANSSSSDRTLLNAPFEGDDIIHRCEVIVNHKFSLVT